MSKLSPEQRQALLAEPAGPPPPGMVANLANPPSLHDAGHAIALVFWGVAFICIAIRLYTKTFIIKQLRISDYMMFMAWAVCIGYIAPSWLLGNLAPAVDQWNLTLQDFMTMLYYTYVLSMLGTTSGLAMDFSSSI
ncbi:uncharacterized protein BO80DRAFT_447146 [Aspergillus ibericus CBS 121593]|uniref:Integral membrane protein n=1 Tax=Aspergillus ibericus CBS 121593 TaxID=1448316 RepID=A0A395GUD1_9EURO|nr:hypothetical protein BO80DRAFT_447146 [Aspergillus ibericus CBS 121593]RAK98784.1 hypothetical protein BO80DRAFT_447146 [Aspergillus ibericus CBS 121593]